MLIRHWFWWVFIMRCDMCRLFGVSLLVLIRYWFWWVFIMRGDMCRLYGVSVVSVDTLLVLGMCVYYDR